MNQRRRAQLVVLLVAALVVAPAGVAVAQTLSQSASAGVTYETDSDVAVTLGDSRPIPQSPFPASDTYRDGNLTVSGADANVTTTTSTFDSYPINVEAVDVTGSLNLTRTDLNQSVVVESGDANSLQVRDYAVGDGTTDFAYDSDGGLTLTLDGFGPIRVVATDASDGSTLDTVDVGSDGEATFTLPSGTRNVELEPRYITDSGVEITVDNASRVPKDPFVDNETFSAGDLTISGSDATIRATEDTFTDDPISARDIDVTGSLTVERSDLSRSFTVDDGDVNLIQMRDYDVEDGTEDFAYDSDNGFSLTLDGFDPIGVAAVDADTGDPIDDVAVDGSGEATFAMPSGTRGVELQPAPSDLTVRNEANPDELVDNATLRARLFAGGEVVERQVTNGKVNLDGVPLDEELIVTVKEENADYVYRRILLESAIQTSEIYLLPTDEPSAEIEFQLADETGRFDSEDTKLFVEKPVTRNNDTQYRVISGDRIGGDGAFPTILVDSERYRLRVVNDAGEQRVLGSYTVQGAERTQLPIGEVTFTEDVDEGAALQAELRESPDSASYDHDIKLTFIDPEAATESIDLQITNSDGDNIRNETTENITGSEAYVETYPITDTSFDPTEDTATVQVEALRNNQIETFEQPLGDVPDVFTNAPLSTQAIEVIALASIVAVVGLLVIISAPLAALVGAGYAGLLSMVGLAPIPMPAVILAGLVGVIATVGKRRV